jgi:hypothetical protein
MEKFRILEGKKESWGWKEKFSFSSVNRSEPNFSESRKALQLYIGPTWNILSHAIEQMKIAL